MKDQIIINQFCSVRQAMEQLDANGKQILIVLENKKVVGVVTDGDIRRFILASGTLDETVGNVINRKPFVLNQNDEHLAMNIMKSHGIRALPIIDDRGNFVKLVTIELLTNENAPLKSISCPVVIMAGGKGTRLYPYTKILPKPLIPIDEVPIVERILMEFRKYGVDQFFMSVNYKASMIKSYFEETPFSELISFVDEDTPLGTIGGLKLIHDKLKESFIVSNCDVLVQADYADLFSYHKKKNNLITIVASVKNVSVPYGVFILGENEEIIDMIEKPNKDYLVNTGLYIMEPRVLDYISEGSAFDFNHLIKALFNHNERVGIYPISEKSWMDMGQITEMKKMIAYFEKQDIE